MPAHSIAIIGAGRVGTALTAALRAAGAEIEGPLGRGSDGGRAQVVLLCVPDAVLAVAARSVARREGRLVGHCSGASTLQPLAPHEAFSMHPLMTVTSEGAIFAGVGCAVAGNTPRALETATDLARTIGMRPFEIADADRPLYHAAASMASNYLITLEGAAERLASSVGVRREQLAPLVRAAVENWVRVGPYQALTGPITRGDEATAAQQRAAIASRASDLLPLWDALTAATRDLVGEGHAS
jgi:predicted short-subunit dehydrogenase-like oxidoreductase (DUF2520 family)